MSTHKIAGFLGLLEIKYGSNIVAGPGCRQRGSRCPLDYHVTNKQEIESALVIELISTIQSISDIILRQKDG